MYFKDILSIIPRSIQLSEQNFQKTVLQQNDRIEQKLDLLLERSDAESVELENNEKILETFCSHQFDAVNKQLLFPWAKENESELNLTLGGAFPACFIHPFLKEDSSKNRISFDELTSQKQYLSSNIIICGDAGSGKSTLLRYLFAFHHVDDLKILYITATEARKDDGILLTIQQILKSKVAIQSHKRNHSEIDQAKEDKYLILIDGVDEEFSSCHEQYRDFLTTLKGDSLLSFWLGCRTDFYNQNKHKDLYFEKVRLTIEQWKDKELKDFVRAYSDMQKNENIYTRVLGWKEDKKLDSSMFGNPFQLSLIVYLAERREELNIRNVYELYEVFINEWISREKERRTTTASNGTIITFLRKVAYEIYNKNICVINSKDDMLIYSNNSAVRNLLIQDYYNIDLEGIIKITAFYHRSLAAFLLAHHLISAFLNSDIAGIERIFALRLKNDVTDFVLRKLEIMEQGDKEKVKNALSELYSWSVQNTKNENRTQERAVYFMTRLAIDVSEFINGIIDNTPIDPYMKLSLAYGCVLSDNPKMRVFALEYAKSLSEDSENARVNRAWTVVYFGDVSGKDQHTYQDDEKSDWDNARKARLIRFSKKQPRIKDYRFWLFDIPLFHSFLKDRDWKGISQEEYKIIASISIPESGVFSEEELSFIKEQKAILLEAYNEQLNHNQI